MNSLSLPTLHSPFSPPLSYTHTTPLNLRIPHLKLLSSSFQANISSPPANPKALGLGLASGFDASSTIYAQGPQYGRRGADTDPMGLLLKERIIFLGNEITDFVADATISQLLMLDAQDPTKDIRLFINSPGGSLNSAIAIYDVLQLVRADVSTIGLGIVASTASIVLGGGTKGKRFAMPNTRIMIHQPLGGISGEALDVLIQAEEIMKNKKTVVDIFSGFTGRTTEQIEKDIDWDRYMSAVEAVEFGILDGVIDRERIIPVVPVSWKVKTRFSELSLEASFLRPEVPDDEIY